MRSLDESRARWRVTRKHGTSLQDLKKSTRSDSSDNPCQAGLRSVCWKTFLLFQNANVTAWSKVLADSRSAYSALREHLMRYVEHPDELGSVLDPLDNDQHSPWNTLRQDEEMRAEIFQDVERCMPDEAYFRQVETQQLMLNILFVFCKINQDVGYRQGMHELLAPILWVVEQDALDIGINYTQTENSDDDEIIKNILDSTYIENDVFTIFSLIMRSAKSFYELGEPDRKSTISMVGNGTQEQGLSPIVERSKRIHEVYLAQVDPELAKHLTDVEILPQIFLIRWIRLLFGREFPFEELLCLWDLLFAEDPQLDLVDTICVAMLLRIRWELLEANYSMALMLLLKYPSPSAPIGPRTFVDDALYLRDNFSVSGGAKIISRHSGKSPSSASSLSETSPNQPMGPRKKVEKAMPPLLSPTRFLQQQGGVEGLFQGAAKNVLDQSERLGINRAVRDAVGEVRKNVQAARASATTRTSDGLKWPLDDSRRIPSSRGETNLLKERNYQLARMLDVAMKDLRAASVASDLDKDHCIKAMDLAIARVDFVKILLEDSSMPLPMESSEIDPPPKVTSTNTTTTQKPLDNTLTEKTLPATKSEGFAENSSKPNIGATPTPLSQAISDPRSVPGSSITTEPPQRAQMKLASPTAARVVVRPKPPVPTRTTIAQSSFSWMLEPDTPSTSFSATSTPPTISSPFLKSGRKPTAGHTRERTAFLFGDDSGESKFTDDKLLSGTEDRDFKLESLKGGDGEETT